MGGGKRAVVDGSGGECCYSRICGSMAFWHGDTLGIDMVHLHLYGGFVRRLVATTTNTNISTSSVLKCPEIK